MGWFDFFRRRAKAPESAPEPVIVSPPLPEVPAVVPPQEHEVAELVASRVVSLTGEITDELASECIAKLLFLDSEDATKPITLRINSSGGSVTATLAIFDAMQMLRAPCMTEGVGQVWGAAVLLLAAGRRGLRRLESRARVRLLRFPEPRGSRPYVQAGQQLRYSFVANLARATGEDGEIIERAVDANVIMNAREAVKLGLVDDVFRQSEGEHREAAPMAELEREYLRLRDSETARVLADFLQEQGDLRGTLAAFWASDRVAEAQAFLAAHHELFFGETGSEGRFSELVWRHGFLSGALLQCRGKASPELHELTERLLSSKMGRFVVGLRFGAAYAQRNDWTNTCEVLAESMQLPHLEWLEFSASLSVRHESLGGVMTLLDGGNLPKLRGLSFRHTELSPGVLLQIVESNVVEQLSVLDLSAAGLTDEHASMLLLNEARLRHLDRLVLSKNYFEQTGELLRGTFGNARFGNHDSLPLVRYEWDLDFDD